MMILANTDSIIVTNNHPSNNVQPSMAELTTMKRLKECCELLRIQILDHIIIGSDKYTRFRGEDLI